MRSISRWMLAAALAVSLGACSDDDKDTKPAEQRVVVLFTTDEHAQLFAYAPEKDDFAGGGAVGSGDLVGGVTRRLAILERERAAAVAAGKDTLTLSSGDFSQGSLASAAWLATSPELKLMKRMGYDAVALGNHEFDLGPAALAGAIQAAGTGAPPLVLTNLFFSAESAADDGLAAMYGPEAGKPIAPYRVLTTAGHGLKIGIVASMGVEAGTVAGAAPPVKFWPEAAATNDQRFSAIADAVQKAVNHLRQEEKVDAVILLAHGGIGQTAAARGEDELLAFVTRGVDLVLSGHSHLSTPTPRTIFSPAGGSAVLVQPKPYGKEVGRIELAIREGTVPLVDVAGATFLPVDDRTAPTTDPAFLNELYTATMGYLEAGNPAATTAPSFLEATLSKIFGTTVTDGADPRILGDLYFMPLGKTDFDVVGLAPGETAALDLDADAILAAANATAPTIAALQASGPIRGDLRVGETGEITFADLYHLVPLGGDPTVAPTGADPDALQTYLNSVPGYPLVRVLIHTVALRAALEGTLAQSLTNGDFFVGVSGLKVRYDMSRAPFDSGNPVSPGWVTYLATVAPDGTEAVLYDAFDPALAPLGGFARNPGDQTWLQPMATTYYVAGFASAFGIPLVDPNHLALIDGVNHTLAETVLARADQSHVKDFEALGAFVKAACDGNPDQPGFLPARYDASGATYKRRMIDCTGTTSGDCAR